MQKLAKAIAITIDVTGPTGFVPEHFTPAQVAADWTGPVAWDAWWSAALGEPVPAFNPNIQAGDFLNYLLVPIGPFTTSGWYDFHMDMVQTQPISQVINWSGTITKPWHEMPGPNSPITGTVDYEFYVGVYPPAI